jgi:hypothetical protein
MASGSQENETGVLTRTAGEALAAYRRVKLNASQQAVYADADDAGIGLTKYAAASGDPVGIKLDNHPGSRKVTCSAAVDVGDILYGADDGKVNDVPTTDGPGLYEALEAGTGDNSLVEAIPIGDSNRSRLLHASVATSAQVENTTTETAFDKSKTIDGGMLRVGDVIHCMAKVNVEDNNGTDTLLLKMKLGSLVIGATAAIDVADLDVGIIDVYVTVRATGAGGQIVSGGQAGLGILTTGTMRVTGLSPTSLDLSGDVALTVTATWSAAHADNECELEMLVADIIRQ